MHDLQTTKDKLLKTPSGDVHAPLFRKLVSAGYKGHLGGVFGGGALYGLIASVIGLVIAVPLAFAPIAASGAMVGGAAFLLVPIMGGLGVWHGVKTFAHIGTTAAILAEGGEIREKRGHLLDRYYDPSTSAEERKEIQKLLDEQLEPTMPDKMFHWKTALFGAAIIGGVALLASLGIMYLGEGLELSHLLGKGAAQALTDMGLAKAVTSGAATAFTLAAPAVAIITAIGAAIGAFVGLDREYVRRWLDHSEGLLNDPKKQKEHLITKVQEVQRLTEAAEKSSGTIAVETIAEPTKTTTATPPAPAPSPMPKTTLSSAVHQERATELSPHQQAV